MKLVGNIIRSILLVSSTAIFAACIYSLYVPFLDFFEIVFGLIITLVLTIFSMFFPITYGRFKKESFYRPLWLWLASIAFSIGLFGIYHFANNYSKVLLKAKFEHEYGFTLSLRANQTYKAHHKGWIGDDLQYGRYQVGSNYIICEGLKFVETAIDTLGFSEEGLLFKIDPRLDLRREFGEIEIEFNEL